MNKEEAAGVAVLRCEQLSKYYNDGNHRIEVFKDLDFTIAAGETVAVIGASGAGKSTLLHLLGGLDQVSDGRIFLKQHDLSKLSANKRGRLRNRHLGFVYQFHHLLPEFSALENVMMPLLVGGVDKVKARRQAMEILQQVGLEQRQTHRPAQLSGGERQRTAIARAMVTRPDCILADEPTGNLDEKTAKSVMDTFIQLNKERNTSLVLVTHDMQIARQMQSIYELKHGDLHRFEG